MSRVLIAVACLYVVGITQLHAVDATFTGFISNVWTVNDNWSNGAPATDVDGTITIESGNGSSPFTITNIDLAYTNINNLTFSSSGTNGDYTLQGTGSLSFNTGGGVTNNKTGTGTISVDILGTGSSLALNATSGAVAITGGIDLSDTGGVQLNIDGSNNTTISGVISGTDGSLNKSGSGTLTLSGSNTHTGGTTLSGGTVVLGDDNALGTGDVSVTSDSSLQSDNDARAISNNFTLNTITRIVGSNQLTLSGDISGTNIFSVQDSATLLLSGSNTHLGGVVLEDSSTLILGNDSALGTGKLFANNSANVTLQSNDDARSISNSIDLLSGSITTINGTNDLTLTGLIANVGALVKSGSNTLTLSGDNTYTGGTTLSTGSIVLGHDNALGTGSLSITGDAAIESNNDARSVSNGISVASGQTLTVAGLRNLTLSGVISGDGALTMDITNLDDTLTLSGTNTYTGGTTLTHGTIIAGNNDAFGTGDVTVAGDARIQSDDDSRNIANNFITSTGNALTVIGSDQITLSGIISGDGGLATFNGTTTLLTGNNTYTGGTSLLGDTLILGNDNALGTGSVTLFGDASFESTDDARSISNGISVASGQTFTVSGDSNLALTGVISGDGGLAVGMDSSSDTLTLSGANTYSGGTTLLGNTLIVGNNNALGTGDVSVTGNLFLQSNNDAISISNNFTIDNVTRITGSNQLTLSGVISGTNGLTVEDSATLLLSGSNTYSGGSALIGSSTLILGNDNALGTSNLITDSDANATLQSNDDARSISNNVVLLSGSATTINGTNDLTLTGVISNTGALVKSGSNTLTLSGSNTYTGGTTLSGGSITIGNNNAFGTGSLSITGDATIQPDTLTRTIGNDVSISSGSTLTVSGNRDLTMTGIISGDGALNVNNSGNASLTLNSSNTYTGGTTLSENGRAFVNANQALGTGTISAIGNSNLTTTSNIEISNATNISSGVELGLSSNNSFNHAGVISGDGSLSLLAIGGSITLSGNNTYTGGTTITQGTLILGNDNALGTGSLSVTGNTTLQSNDDARSVSYAIAFSGSQTLTLSGSNDLALSGVISGSGSLAVGMDSASDTLTLSGVNTYSGGTTLLGSTLIIGNNDALGTGNLSVDDDAVIQSNSDDRTISNTTSISSGNTLTVSGSNDFELSGVISGDGGLTKEGSSTATLSGNNTFTGDTTVTAGTLIINGTMASGNVNVASGATLSGVMNFAGNFINSGTVSPGNSPGTMIVGGNLTLNSTSIYDMEIASTAGPGTGNDFIDVTGTAAIDGTLNVIGLGGYSATDGDTFTILDADGGVSGTFATILDDIAGFEATATYNANDITVTLNAATADFANTVTARNLVFAAEAFTRIANNSPTGDMATVIAQLENQTGNNLVVAFEQIVPNYLVPQAEATFKGIDVQNNNFNGRFNELRNGLPKLWSNNLGVNTPDNASINDSADPEFAMMLAMQAQETLEQQQETARFTGAEKDIWGAWVNGFGTFGDYDSTSSQAGYNFNTGGVTFGFDYRVLDTLAAGAFVGYSNTGVTVDNGQGTNSFNSINTGMYMTWFNEEGFYASGLFGGGVNFYENNRRIRFGTVDRVAESDPTGFYLQTLATGGYEFKKGNWGFGPQLALQWVNLQIGSHSETGADSLNLNVGAFNGNSFVTRLGFRATYEYDTDAMLFVPELVGFWEHEYLDPINTVDVGVPAGGESFTYTGIGPGRDSGLIGVNLVGISHEAPVSFTLQYNVEFTPDDFIVNNVYAGVRISF
ncbi:beta strand repeat-containing protein [Poriferisphaera sp. WC338]|uniref:beta strand repeat-containing protein n=1 Tax=Poriferisphaera sp. WC338 TaxID=3425129 RepID=UPI003D81313E